MSFAQELVNEFRIPLADDKVRYKLTATSFDPSSEILSLSVLKQEELRKDKINLPIYAPYFMHYVLDEQLELKEQNFRELRSAMRGEDYSLIKDFPGAFSGHPEKKTNTGRLLKMNQSLSGNPWIGFNEKEYFYDISSDRFYTNMLIVEKGKTPEEDILKVKKGLNKSQELPTVYPQHEQVEGLKKQRFMAWVDDSFSDAKAHTLIVPGGIRIRGKKLDKHNHYKQQFILTFDQEGQEINKITLPFQYPRSIEYSQGLNKKQVFSNHSTYDSYVFIYERVFGIGKKNNDPDPLNHWIVHVGKQGREIFKTKIHIGKKYGGKVLFAHNQGDALILLFKEDTDKFGLMKFNEGKQEFTKTISYTESKSFLKGNGEGMSKSIGKSFIVQGAKTLNNGDFLFYGQYKEEVTKAIRDPKTLELNPAVYAYPQAVALHFSTEGEFKGQYAVDLKDWKFKAPSLLSEMEIFETSNNQLLWVIHNVKSTQVKGNDKFLLPYGRYFSDLEMAEDKPFSVNEALVNLIDTDKGNMNPLQIQKEKEDKPFISFSENTYLYVPEKNWFFLFGAERNKENNIDHLLIKKYQL
ncbi:hypothetical protein E1171_11180 [Cytophagales bacterium RKSG123]|nr:hypothetical protein [Xanthovirga aplysinae]